MGLRDVAKDSYTWITYGQTSGEHNYVWRCIAKDTFLLICRCNTSLLIDYCQANGEHNYILIDAGKNFREQVLRWFTFHKISRVDSVSLYPYIYTADR